MFETNLWLTRELWNNNRLQDLNVVRTDDATTYSHQHRSNSNLPTCVWKQIYCLLSQKTDKMYASAVLVSSKPKHRARNPRLQCSSPKRHTACSRQKLPAGGSFSARSSVAFLPTRLPRDRTFVHCHGILTVATNNGPAASDDAT